MLHPNVAPTVGATGPAVVIINVSPKQIVESGAEAIPELMLGSPQATTVKGSYLKIPSLEGEVVNPPHHMVVASQTPRAVRCAPVSMSVQVKPPSSLIEEPMNPVAAPVEMILETVPGTYARSLPHMLPVTVPVVQVAPPSEVLFTVLAPVVPLYKRANPLFAS